MANEKQSLERVRNLLQKCWDLQKVISHNSPSVLKLTQHFRKKPANQTWWWQNDDLGLLFCFRTCRTCRFWSLPETPSVCQAYFGKAAEHLSKVQQKVHFYRILLNKNEYFSVLFKIWTLIWLRCCDIIVYARRQFKVTELHNSANAIGLKFFHSLLKISRLVVGDT